MQNTMRKTKQNANRFDATLLRPEKAVAGDEWIFALIPKEISETLPRRGRTNVDCELNGHAFSAALEPDGQLSHWLKLDAALMRACKVKAGDHVSLSIQPSTDEIEPTLPADFKKALTANKQAMTTWQATTTIARIDWVHWVESAKQAKTRATRIANGCDMLAAGDKRVCCFDNSGFYSKSLSAPKTAT
jgi:Bacteriocin-protection, YdeI or OmpD-Associated/Domain of unknown function (DUF1905)